MSLLDNQCYLNVILPTSCRIVSLFEDFIQLLCSYEFNGNEMRLISLWNYSFVPIDKNKINQSVVIHIPGYTDNSRKFLRNKYKLKNKNENEKTILDKKIPVK